MCFEVCRLLSPYMANAEPCPGSAITTSRGVPLRRQFPVISGRARGGIEPFRSSGPIQSQVPRAPFLTISSRLPGATHETVCELSSPHQLVKTSNIG